MLGLVAFYEQNAVLDRTSSFHKVVHDALGIEESRFLKESLDADKEPEDLALDSKEWRYWQNTKKLSEFFQAAEDSLYWQDEELRTLEFRVGAETGLEDKLKKFAEGLVSKFIYRGIFKHFGAGDSPTATSCPVIQAQDADGNTIEHDFSNHLAGGLQNMISTVIGFTILILGKFQEKALEAGKKLSDFKDDIKKTFANNINLLLGMSKLELDVFFRFLNQSANHIESNYHPFYRFNWNDFKLVREKDGSFTLKPFMKAVQGLIDGIKQRPQAFRYGKPIAINFDDIAYGCPAVYIRTKTKQNSIEFMHDRIAEAMDKTFFAHLDDWVGLA